MVNYRKNLQNLLIFLFVIYRIYIDHKTDLYTFFWAFFVLYGLFSQKPNHIKNKKGE